MGQTLGKSRAIRESRGLYVFLLIADILNIIAQEVILLSNGDRRTSAIAAFSTFGVLAFLLFVPLTISHWVQLCLYNKHYVSFIASTIQTIGAILFFYGNNITNLVGSWGEEVNCGVNCIENARITASFSLGVSLMIFNFVPSMMIALVKLLQIKKQVKEKKTKTPDWISALDIVVKINNFYAALVGMVQSPDFCSNRDISISTAYLGVCVIFGLSAEIIYYAYALTTNKGSHKPFSCLVSMGMLVMVISLPLYLLADNRQPLDCAFGCDTFAANSTISTELCDQVTNSAVRLGFTGIIVVPLVPIAFVYFFYNRIVVRSHARTQELGTQELGTVSPSEDIALEEITDPEKNS